MQNTLVQLMEHPHIEYMYGRLRGKNLQEIHQSWEKITKSYYDTLDLENKTKCIACDNLVWDCMARCPCCGVFSA